MSSKTFKSYERENNAKIKFDDVYNLEDPKFYYRELLAKEYKLPDKASFSFSTIIERLFQKKRKSCVKILDLGCSYGVNSAVLKFSSSMQELHNYYNGQSRALLSKNERIKIDRLWFSNKDYDKKIKFVGLDSSKKAVNYALSCGLLEKGFSVDLEVESLTEMMLKSIQDTDLIISTGCVGYITDITFEKILSALSISEKYQKPWIAIFVMRLFDISNIQKTVEKYDLDLIRTRIIVEQRNFSSNNESKHILDIMRSRGLDTSRESLQGKLFAELFLAIPHKEVNHLLVEELILDIEVMSQKMKEARKYNIT